MESQTPQSGAPMAVPFTHAGELPAEPIAAAKKAAAERAVAEKAAAKKAAAERAVAEKAVAEKAVAEKAVAEKAGAEKAGAEKAAGKRASAKKAAAVKAPAVKKAAAAKASAKAPAKATAKKTPAKKAPAVKALAKKAPAVQAPAVQAPARKAPAVQAPAKKSAAAKSPAPEKAAPPRPAPIKQTRFTESPAEPHSTTAVTEEPPPAATDDAVQRAWSDNRLAQVLYHDWESTTYDDKWSISFDERCISYARDRFAALVGPQALQAEPWPYPKALEIGAGTGFFALNLKQAGVIGDVHVTDVSAGMVETAKRNARELGFEVQGDVASAESLPYDDDTFDLVVGHAVIHHVPDVESALREVLRVLKPGGRFAIAGEPSRVGDWYARRLGRLTWAVTTRVTHLPPLRDRWAKPAAELHESSRAAALESVVDLHTFVPDELADTARRAGAVDVHTQSEELLAAFLGWPVRTFEAAVNPERLGWGWAMFAYRSWQRLSAVDRVLARALPKGVFYNVGVTGRKPI